MPRKRIVSRAVTLGETTGYFVNPFEDTYSTKTLTIHNRSFKSKEQAMKYLKKQYDTDRVFLRDIDYPIKTTNKIVGMTLDDFIKKATVLTDSRKMPN